MGSKVFPVTAFAPSKDKVSSSMNDDDEVFTIHEFVEERSIDTVKKNKYKNFIENRAHDDFIRKENKDRQDSLRPTRRLEKRSMKYSSKLSKHSLYVFDLLTAQSESMSSSIHHDDQNNYFPDEPFPGEYSNSSFSQSEYQRKPKTFSYEERSDEEFGTVLDQLTRESTFTEDGAFFAGNAKFPQRHEVHSNTKLHNRLSQGMKGRTYDHHFHLLSSDSEGVTDFTNGSSFSNAFPHCDSIEGDATETYTSRDLFSNDETTRYDTTTSFEREMYATTTYENTDYEGRSNFSLDANNIYCEKESRDYESHGFTSFETDINDTTDSEPHFESVTSDDDSFTSCSSLGDAIARRKPNHERKPEGRIENKVSPESQLQTKESNVLRETQRCNESNSLLYDEDAKKLNNKRSGTSDTILSQKTSSAERNLDCLASRQPSPKSQRCTSPPLGLKQEKSVNEHVEKETTSKNSNSNMFNVGKGKKKLSNRRPSLFSIPAFVKEKKQIVNVNKKLDLHIGVKKTESLVQFDAGNDEVKLVTTDFSWKKRHGHVVAVAATRSPRIPKTPRSLLETESDESLTTRRQVTATYIHRTATHSKRPDGTTLFSNENGVELKTLVGNLLASAAKITSESMRSARSILFDANSWESDLCDSRDGGSNNETMQMESDFTATESDSFEKADLREADIRLPEPDECDEEGTSQFVKIHSSTEETNTIYSTDEDADSTILTISYSIVDAVPACGLFGTVGIETNSVASKSFMNERPTEKEKARSSSKTYMNEKSRFRNGFALSQVGAYIMGLLFRPQNEDGFPSAIYTMGRKNTLKSGSETDPTPVERIASDLICPKEDETKLISIFSRDAPVERNDKESAEC